MQTSQRAVRLAHRRFAVKVVVSFVGALGVLFGFNVVMNPFGVWPNLLGKAVSPQMTARINSVRTVKAYDLLTRTKGAKEKHLRAPDAIVIGMSTVAWGIDPEGYAAEDQVLYNAGIPGSSAEEQYHYLRAMLEQAPSIKTVYIDVNPGAYTNMGIVAADFDFDRLAPPHVPTGKDLMFTGVSRYVTMESIRAYRLNRNKLVTAMVRDNGDGHHRFPPADFDVYKNNVSNLLNSQAPQAPTGTYIVNDQIDYLKKMVVLCETRGVTPVIYFAPVHATLVEFMRYRNEIHVMLDLRRRVVEFRPVWDFGLCNEIVGEPIDQMRYFIDPIHYRPLTGTYMLATMLGKRPDACPDTFGVRVDATNIDAQIKRFLRGLDQWRYDNPRDANFLLERFTNTYKLQLPPAQLDRISRNPARSPDWSTHPTP